LENLVGSFQNYKSLGEKKKDIASNINNGEAFNYKGHDVVNYVTSLALFMESLGVNLSPYPTIKLLETTEYENELLGYTGDFDYYEGPVISVWTSGRHIKDFMRTVAHELWHHHQNLNGLNIESVDVKKLEDPTWAAKEKFLGDFENFVYLEGDTFLNSNLIFRAWTDAIKQDLIKL
jgi:hypothetical protein